MGTICTYQGLPCRDVIFRRTRGWKADTSSVVFFAADFPDDFEFVPPQPGQLRSQTRFDLRLLAPVGTPVPPPFPRRLEFAGPLVMAEVDRLGNQFVTVVQDLYCVSVETLRRNHDGSIAVVAARLVDARYFNAQGFVRRWSFNRTDAEGQYAKDSVKDDGQPFTLAEVATDIAKQLFTTPVLSRVPETWKTTKPALELPPFAPAAAALGKLAREHGAGDPCLCLDGSLALYLPGDGRVGHAPNGKGAANSADFPASLFLDLRGTGQVRGLEITYPPDFVLVVGGLRVASVRMDDLEPVLLIEGTPIPLTEETVRKLTGGKHGLEWLNVFVLAPQAYQNQVDLDPRVVQLLREQAYRLWRLPGVEIEQQPREAMGVTPWTPTSIFGTPPSFDQVVAGLRKSASGEPNRVRGPNAHLLPLLDRAETVAGRRLPVRIDTYRFASVHRAMGGTQEAAAAYTAQRELAAVREEVRRTAHSLGKPDPFHATEWSFWSDERHLSVPELQGLMKDLGLGHLSHEQLQRAVEQQRLIDRVTTLSGDLGKRYANALNKLHELEQQAGGVSQTLSEIARQIVDVEREAAESRDAFEDLSDEFRDYAAELRHKLQDDLRELDRQLADQGTRTRLGAARKATPQTAVFIRNLPRELDPDARVVSAELGVIQTSDLSGHVAEEGVPVAEATRFVPKPPLVTFGAVLRPKVGGSNRVMTGGSSKSETKIPSVLSDRESYYTAAFRRTQHGRAEPIAVDAIPPGEGVPIDRPDLVELVPLEGDTNRGRLDETARVLAEAAFHRPDRVESAKYSIARPWPVNCDGVVAGVEIAMRPNGKGFVTTIYTGSEGPAFTPSPQTRERPRRQRPSDGAAREGMLP